MKPYQRRFGGVGRLFGVEGLERLRQAHVCVIGLGGVGSWAVEALARSGVGELTLVDMDDVCVGNVNRQLHSLEGEFGKPKVEVMTGRVQAINPECVVHPHQCFFLKSNADELLEPNFAGVIDAIDRPSLKALLIARCHARGIPVVSAGAAGGRRDPTNIEVVDLAFSSHDRLLMEVRRNLRRHHGFPRGERPFGVECVISREPAVYPTQCGTVGALRDPSPDLRLDCNSGFGTASFVTGTFGFAVAARLVEKIANAPDTKRIGREKAPLTDA